MATVVIPKNINRSFWIWILSGAVVLISAILNWAGVGAKVVDDAAKAGAASAGPWPAFTIVMAIIMVVCAWFMRQGKNWARLVLAVVGLISIITTIVSMISLKSFAVGGWIGLISFVLTILAVVLMYMKDSNRFMAAVPG